MAVQTEISRVTYTGNNSTVTPYPVPFKFFLDGDLQVATLADDGTASVLTISTDYTVTGAGNELGGAIVTVAAIPATTLVTIARVLPATQLAEFEEADRFPARTFENALDKLTMLVQRQLADASDSVRVIAAQGPLNPVQLAPNRILATMPASNQMRAITGAQLQTLLNLPGTVIDQPTKTFADNTERGLATPDFLGQVGTQLDTNNLYVGTSLVAGGWTLYTVAGSLNINGLDPESTIDLANDTVAFYDNSVSANRKAAIGDLVPPLSVTTGKLADGVLSADAAGRAKMADGFVTLPKIPDGVLSADSAGRAKMADAFVTPEKLTGAQTGAAPIYGARAWVCFDGARNAADDGASTNGANVKIFASGNVTSVLKNGVGDYTVTFTTAMPDANYAISLTASGNAAITGYEPASTTSVPSTKTTTQIRIETRTTMANSDFRDVSLVVYR